MGRQGYSAEFRRKVLDLLAEGRSVACIAHTISTSATRRSTTGGDKTESTKAPSPA